MRKAGLPYNESDWLVEILAEPKFSGPGSYRKRSMATVVDIYRRHHARMEQQPAVDGAGPSNIPPGNSEGQLAATVSPMQQQAAASDDVGPSSTKKRKTDRQEGSTDVANVSGRSVYKQCIASTEHTVHWVASLTIDGCCLCA